MADKTQFYFAAAAAGMRQEDIDRAIELAASMTSVAQDMQFFSPVIWFSPRRMSLRPNGTLIAPNESLYLASGHVFVSDWTTTMKYRFKPEERLTRLWDFKGGFASDFLEVTYL